MTRTDRWTPRAIRCSSNLSVRRPRRASGNHVPRRVPDSADLTQAEPISHHVAMRESGEQLVSGGTHKPKVALPLLSRNEVALRRRAVRVL